MSKPTEKPKSKKSELLWDQMFSNLSPEAKAAIGQQVTLAPAVSEEEMEFQSFHRAASQLGQQSLRRPTTPGEVFSQGLTPDSQHVVPGYWVVEQEEGENPTRKNFRNNVKALAEYLAKLKDKDVFVHIFYGVPLHFTKEPNRTLLLLDNTAVQFQPIVRMLKGLTDAVEVQEDGFMGPPELQMLVPLTKKTDDDTRSNSDPDAEFPD